jgi:hypothetical protein
MSSSSIPDVRLRVGSGSNNQQVELTLVLKDPPDQLGHDFWDAVLSHFATVVSFGGVCGVKNLPTASSFVLQGKETPAESTLRYRFEIRGIDPGAWRILLGLYLAASECSFPISRLEILSREKNPRDWLDVDRAFATAYPAHPHSLPFLLERSEEGEASEDRLIQVAFHNPPEESVFREFSSALLSWDEVLLGGYPQDGQSPAENATDATEVYLINSVTIEHPLPNFLGSESAFDAVICMALWFHLRRARVQSVTID